MRLTQKAIDRANKRRKYSDGRGLFLSVSKNGRKTWAFCYTFGGRSREMGLGSIDFLSLDDARDKAVELRKLIRSGIDPLSERQAEERLVIRRKRTGSTFREVAVPISGVVVVAVEDGAYNTTFIATDQRRSY